MLFDGVEMGYTEYKNPDPDLGKDGGALNDPRSDKRDFLSVVYDITQPQAEGYRHSARERPK
jgi:hypothetical protein